MSDVKVVSEEASKAQAESIRFLQSHIDYLGDELSNQKLANYIREHNPPWTTQSLEIAYEELHDELRHRSGQEVKERAAQLTKQLLNPPQEFPWETPLTKQVLNRMKGEDLKKFMKDKRFLDQLNETFRRNI
jgi:hypothetical protein